MSSKSEKLFNYCLTNSANLHTQDERYTPPAIYDAVLSYVNRHYDLKGKNVVRPFIPGGDYQAYPYSDGDVVVDNPPFSMTTEIVKWYLGAKIPFFLFINGMYGVSLTRSIAGKATVILAGCGVKYHTGEPVSAGFVTNLDDPAVVIKTAPDLYKDLVSAQNRRKFPKYGYPEDVLRSPQINVLSKKGFDFQLTTKDCKFVNNLDGMKAIGKSVFGGAFLVSDQAYDNYCNLLASYQDPNVKSFELSDKEKKIVQDLTNNNKEM